MKGSTSFDWSIVAKHLCSIHKVSDVPYINLYGQGAVEAWTLSHAKTIGLEFSIQGRFNPNKKPEEQVVESLLSQARPLYKSLQPDDKFVHPLTNLPMESDLEQVSIYQVRCEAYTSTMPIPVAVRMNWQHASQSALEGTDVVDGIFAAADGIRGQFASLNPTTDKEERIKACPLPQLDYGYQNGQFAQTFAYLNEHNIRNGIVEIPPSVCVEAGLPIWKGTPVPPEDLVLKQLQSMKIEDVNSDQAKEAKASIVKQYGEQFMEQYNQENSKPITHYVALPYNHVLAWGYASDAYLNQKNHRVYRFSYRDDNDTPILLYYLVPNVLMDHLLEEATEVWLSKVDKRPLSSVGMQFLPHPTPEYANVAVDQPGKVMLRVYYSYMSGPRLKEGTINALAPVMCPDFPPCHSWSSEEMARKAAFEEYERQHK